MLFKRGMANAWFGVLAIAGLAVSVPAQGASIVETLGEHTYVFTYDDGEFGGTGMEFLVREAADAQFVLIAEEHNVRELPELVAALFAKLHVAHGFQHLAIESDPVSAVMASSELRGDLQTISAYARRFPYAFTFATDQELAMLESVGLISTTEAHPVWGFDQVFGATHVLDYVGQRTQGLEDALRAVREAALPHESSRDSETHFLAETRKNADFYALEEIHPTDADAAHALEQLLLSDRIYHPYYDQGMPERQRAFYESGLAREQNMKGLFMREYRRAEAAGEELPRVLVKAGHWHIAYGRYPQSQLLTLGNFLAELATSHGMTTLNISAHVYDGEEAWRSVKGRGAFAHVEGLIGEDSVVIDLRPLRHLWKTEEIQGAGLTSVLFASDLVLLLNGARKATYDLLRGR